MVKSIWVAFAVFLAQVNFCAFSTTSKPGFLESLVRYIAREGLSTFKNEPPDQATIRKEYDFIIVGAGTAGCAVANRLSENQNWKILLIEAGSAEVFYMDMPIIANYLQYFDANWKYYTEPSNTSCLAMKKGHCHWPRGKVMGGSSVLNYMVFTRGNRRDYDQWEANGNTGWGWSDVLPYFKKLENFDVDGKIEGRQKMHGRNGYVTVSSVPYRTKMADAFVDAAKFLDPPQPIVDFNGPTQTGFNYVQATMRNGSRVSSSKAYLHPIKRKNLHVKKNSHVTKILISPKTKTAYGVEFVKNSKKYVVKARKDVILSAGTIGSAQLLMLSGVGPQDHLEKIGIPVIKDAPVGFNLQDHVAAGGLTYTIEKPFSVNVQRILNTETLAEYYAYHTGPVSIPGGVEALAFFDLNNQNSTDGWPDLELLFIAGGIGAEPTLKKAFNIEESVYQELFKKLENVDQAMVFPMVMRPKSFGRLMLASKNPKRKPLIYPGYFTDPDSNDIKVAVAGIRKSNEIFRTPPFQSMGAKLHSTPLHQCQKHKFNSDKYWDCYTRHLTFTIYHHVGTAKMGPASDPTAVVDPRLRVTGVKKLRVIDASIMPTIVSGHTNAPTFMIAEKGSDMIKEDWRS